MEETKTRPGSPGDRAQIAAEKLRALRERANQAMDEHRGRLSQIESELSSRVRQLADEFEHTAASGQMAAGPEEVAALREQLEEDRARHAKFVEQLSAARRQLDAIQSQPCAACADAAHQLADAQGEIGRLREQLQTAGQQQEEDAARHQKFAEQVAAARQAIADLQAASHDQSVHLQAELDSARAAKNAAEEQVAGLARDLELLQAECDALQTRADKLEQERTASLDDQRRAAEAEASQLRNEIATLKADAENSQRAYDSLSDRAKSLEGDLATAQQQRDTNASEAEDARRQISELESKLAGLSATTSDAKKAQAEKLSAAESRIAELQEQLSATEAAKSQTESSLTSAEAQRQTAEESLAAAKREIEQLKQANSEFVALKAALEAAQADAAKNQQARDEAKSSLEQAQADLAKLQIEFCPKTERDDLQRKLELALADVQKLKGDSCPKAERDDLQQKFDLALADVQKLKKENGALREDLASRPAGSDESSPELIALRSECESLTARVKELEQAAANAASSDASQEVDDLHRRFEMAVDDVRQLKQENLQLREQLEKGKALGAAAGGSPGGGNDWASQKARLLAMLADEEDGPIDAERRKQRATIEDTIQRTDAAIAEKERELAELRAAQASHVEGPSCNLDRHREELLSADEQIAIERERLAKLQSEWEGKLRAAELEFSVERAKLAREQAALKERMFELQKLEAQGAGLAAEGGDMKPRRRWLDALGLGDEGKDGKK